MGFNPLYLEPVLALLVDGYEVVAVVGRAIRLVLEGALLRQQPDVDAGEVDGPEIRVVTKFSRKKFWEKYF
jgi:hypothetical protein